MKAQIHNGSLFVDDKDTGIFTGSVSICTFCDEFPCSLWDENHLIDITVNGIKAKTTLRALALGAQICSCFNNEFKPKNMIVGGKE